MIGVKSHADKAIDAVERNRAALARSTGRLAEHDAARPIGDDADALYDWRRRRPDLDDRVEADREALAFAEKRAEQARAEAAAKAADAEHAAAEKRVAADAKRLAPAYESWVASGLQLMAQFEASRELTAAVNERRGSRAFIADAETRVRQRPGRTIPASYRDEVVWEDGAGNRPYTYRRDETGELVPRESGFQRRVISVCQGEERHIPPEMPERLNDAIRLVSLDGEQIFPPR